MTAPTEKPNPLSGMGVIAVVSALVCLLTLSPWLGWRLALAVSAGIDVLILIILLLVRRRN